MKDRTENDIKGKEPEDSRDSSGTWREDSISPTLASSQVCIQAMTRLSMNTSQAPTHHLSPCLVLPGFSLLTKKGMRSGSAAPRCYRHQTGEAHTYSIPEMRPYWEVTFHTCPKPPTLAAPTMITTSCPRNMTSVWNTSVQMTAFSPPCRERAVHLSQRSTQPEGWTLYYPESP